MSAHTITYNQDVPLETNRPGTQVLEATILCNGTDTFAALTFPKPFRTAPKVLSWSRQDAVANAEFIDSFQPTESPTTDMIAFFSTALNSSEIFKVYIVGELAPS